MVFDDKDPDLHPIRGKFWIILHPFCPWFAIQTLRMEKRIANLFSVVKNTLLEKVRSKFQNCYMF